jgi:TPR repeat protein
MKKNIQLFIAFFVLFSPLSKAYDFYEYSRDLEKKAKSGDKQAQAMILDHYVDGWFLNDEDFNGIRSIINKSFVTNVLEDKNNPFSIYLKGVALQNGSFGYSEDKVQGKKLVDSIIESLKKMGNEGDASACLILFYIYNGGQSSEEINKKEAFDWATKSHNLGNPIGTFALSSILVHNTNKQDYDNGMSWLRTAKIPKHIKENAVLDIILHYLIADDYDFDMRRTGFQTLGVSNEVVICTLLNERLGLTLQLMFNFNHPDKKTSLRLGNPFRLTIISSDSNRAFADYRFFCPQQGDDGVMLVSLEKAMEWDRKARELRPDGFTKKINLDSVREMDWVDFDWDGMYHVLVNNKPIGTAVRLSNLYGKIMDKNEKSLYNKCQKKLADMHENNIKQDDIQNQFN